MFLHASFLHVGGNMLFLWIFGYKVAYSLRQFRYLLFYLVSGLAAEVTHILLNAHSSVPSIGASGAIAGVMGAYFILYPRARVLVWFPPIFLFHVPAWLMLGYWFLINFLSGTATSIAESTQASGGVAFWAHVGGFVAGMLMVKVFSERPHRYRYGSWSNSRKFFLPPRCRRRSRRKNLLLSLLHLVTGDEPHRDRPGRN